MSNRRGNGPSLEPADLLRHVKVLSERFPHRHAGEPDEIGAVAYIADTMRDIGLAVEVLEVPVMGWEIAGEPSLEIVQPFNEHIECCPFIFSGSTPQDGLEGELRRIGPSLIAGGFEWEKFAVVDNSGQWRGFVVGRPEGPAIAQAGPPAGLAGAADVPLYTWPSCIIRRQRSRARQQCWRRRQGRKGALPLPGALQAGREMLHREGRAQGK